MSNSTHDATGWPIFRGSHVRVNPRGGLAYWADVVTVDGTRVTARDRKGLMRFVDPKRCCVVRQGPKARKASPVEGKVQVVYKNPFPRDRGN